MAGGVTINGQVLRELRWLAGLTQEGFAAACRAAVNGCCMSREEANAYENERGDPSLFTLNAIYEVVRLDKVPPERRALIRTPTLDAALAKAITLQANGNGGHATHRNNFLKLLLASGTGVVLPPLHLDAEPGDQLGENLYRLHSTTPPADLLPHARLHAAQTSSVDAFCFAGWLAHLLDYRGEARAWFTQARKAAVNDVELARALVSQSAAYTESQLGKMLAEEARERARAADPWTRLYTAIRLAKELAAAGDRQGCYRTLDAAEHLTAVADPGEQGGWFSPAAFFAGWPMWMPVLRAEVHVRLGDAARAEPELAEAARSTTGTVLRVPVRQLVIVGKVARLQDDPQQACAALGDAWDQALATGYERAIGWIVEARDTFPREWAPTTWVKAFDERVRGAL